MNRIAASILLATIVVACKKHEDATARPEATATPASSDSTSLASPAPSESVAAAPSASSSATPLVSAQQFALAPDASIFGEPIREPFSTGNGLVGTGPGSGGGTGETIGLGHPIGGGGRVHAPKVRTGQATVMGRLPTEVINRIVRRNLGRFRVCYEQGLAKDPTLSGTIATKFVIGAQGAVSTAARDASSTMKDTTVASCVTNAFSSLMFPQPESGIVVVVYPVIFEPSD
jgi:hypothetical protein